MIYVIFLKWLKFKIKGLFRMKFNFSSLSFNYPPNYTAMKFSLILVMFMFLSGCGIPNSQNEMEAIKQAIEQETASFYKVEKKNWDDSWVHSPYAYWSYSDSTGTSFLEGWENINKNFDGYFKTQVSNRNIDVAHPEDSLIIERNWKEIRIYDGGAYVQYTQRVKDSQIARDETSQIRILEKQAGKWLITYVGIIAKYPD
jgi:hypothetical protein